MALAGWRVGFGNKSKSSICLSALRMALGDSPLTSSRQMARGRRVPATFVLPKCRTNAGYNGGFASKNEFNALDQNTNFAGRLLSFSGLLFQL